MENSVFTCNLLTNSAGAVVMLCPIAAGQIGIGNRGAGIGGVDKLSAACVDTNVTNAASHSTGKEYNVAGLQFGLTHGSTLLVLIRRCAVGRIAKLLKYIVHKARAVKSAGTCTAVDIAHTQIFLGFCQNIRSSEGAAIAGGVIFCIPADSAAAGGNTGGLAL